MPWNPEQYHRFQQERSAPFHDLVSLIPRRTGISAIDLGCGTGELTVELTRLLPNSEVLGVDSSPQMLERAQRLESPGVHFTEVRIEEVEGTWDLVFSHAAIQWIDDHQTLVPRLLSLLRPGGRLAVQIPSNHGHPSHQMIRQIAEEDPFGQALGGWMRLSPVLSITDYAQLLYDHGGVDLAVFEKVYPHVLPDADAIAEWTKGTALVPYMERLPEALHGQFMDRYREMLRAHWPSGPVFYGFRRTLFAATRP